MLSVCERARASWLQSKSCFVPDNRQLDVFWNIWSGPWLVSRVDPLLPLCKQFKWGTSLSRTSRIAPLMFCPLKINTAHRCSYRLKHLSKCQTKFKTGKHKKRKLTLKYLGLAVIFIDKQFIIIKGLQSRIYIFAQVCSPVLPWGVPFVPFYIGAMLSLHLWMAGFGLTDEL